ncbi:ParM/StbA family protein (plasmid) [Methylomarinum sp. Ch1-1]|uniref:ParM/StbA family protein n=1 Tax=Methylomarinum roseum TaxID=3067653 RepID=A0AAU7P0R3_9GAMM|nr:ParM/StbA family protein [Methylomarinum sp. Ch1-1]MDP4523197.1 ParM/StbA family protein [Methylomarinum sp. Ch1-1]
MTDLTEVTEAGTQAIMKNNKLEFTVPMEIAIDVGSGFTKYTNGVSENNLPSLVCPFTSDGDFGVLSDEVVTFGGQSYLTGISAFNFGGKANERFSTLTEDWAGSEGWMALIYRVIGNLGITTGKIKLATGIPQSYFTRDRDRVLKVLNRSHEFVFQGIEHSVEIEAVLIPQAAATLFYAAANDESVLDDYVGCIDVGTYTTGFSVINGMRFVPRLGGGLSVGMSELHGKLREELKHKGFVTDDSRYEQICTQKRYRHQGQVHDITGMVNDLAMSVAGKVIDEINREDGNKESWNGAGEMRVFITGGGANHFAPAIKSSIHHLEVMDDSFYAVAKGMLIYLKNKE